MNANSASHDGLSFFLSLSLSPTHAAWDAPTYVLFHRLRCLQIEDDKNIWYPWLRNGSKVEVGLQSLNL